MIKPLFVSFETGHIDEAISLLSIYYKNEKENVPELPSFSDYRKLLKNGLQTLVKSGHGIALIENGALIGYMAGYPVDRFFGKEKGVFVPVFGHAAVLSRRNEIEQRLYVEIADRWVKKSVYTHSIAVFAHDDLLKEMWFHLGFGNRCVDSIRQIIPDSLQDSLLTFEEVSINNAATVASIHEQHHRYYRTSPIFMPNPKEDALVDLIDWLSKNGNRMFSVKYNHVIAGYIRYQIAGESLFSIHQNMRNITGLFVLPEFRNLGLGEKLLQHAESILKADGRVLIGVDYESINPNANRFWSKHFTPYTYSLVRRIDERIGSITETD